MRFGFRGGSQGDGAEFTLTQCLTRLYGCDWPGKWNL